MISGLGEPRSRPGRGLPTGGSTCLAALMLLGTAVAQEVPSASPTVEYAPRPPAATISPQDTQPSAASKDFRLIFTLPLLATNNAIGPTSEVTGASGKPDTHVNPDLLLRWAHQFDFVRLSANGDIALDRYHTNTNQSSDTLKGGFRAALTDGRSDLFVPYAAYGVISDYEPGWFVTRDDIFHNFSLGFTSGIGISAEGGIIPFRDSSGAGDWSVALDIVGGERLADPRDYQNAFAAFTTDVVYNLTPDYRFGLLSTLRFRDYDSYYSQNRRDAFLAFQARLELTPDWLTRTLPGAEIDLAISYQQNTSTVPTQSYSRWEGGPIFILTQRF